MRVCSYCLGTSIFWQIFKHHQSFGLISIQIPCSKVGIIQYSTKRNLKLYVVKTLCCLFASKNFHKRISYGKKMAHCWDSYVNTNCNHFGEFATVCKVRKSVLVDWWKAKVRKSRDTDTHTQLFELVSTGYLGIFLIISHLSTHHWRGYYIPPFPPY